MRERVTQGSTSPARDSTSWRNGDSLIGSSQSPRDSQSS